jgi:hypothetical protein
MCDRSSLEQLPQDAELNRIIEGWYEIRSPVMRIFGGDFALAWGWFITPTIALDSMPPLELVAMGELETVKAHLTRMEYCAYT